MKKIILTLLLSLILIPTTFFYGCKKNIDNGIDLSFYFEDKVTYNVVGRTNNNTTLNDLVHNDNNNLQQYTKITVTGKPANLYKMTIEKISFDVYSNVQVDDLQITVSMTNMENGNSSLSSSTTFKKEVPIKTVENGIAHVSIDVNDVVKSISSSSSASSISFCDGAAAKITFAIPFSAMVSLIALAARAAAAFPISFLVSYA